MPGEHTRPAANKYTEHGRLAMKIIVSGCGKIGKAVLASLVYEGHDVTAMDRSPSVIEEITNTYDVMTICGNGADCETLEEAGIDKADLFISFTDSDELNMLSCFLAKKMGAKHTCARIRNPEYNDQSLGFMRQQLGLSMSVNPEQLIALEIFNILKLPSAVKIENFSRRNLEMVELVLAHDSELDGMTLRRIREKYKANYLICAVQREEEIFIPDGSFVLRAGDRIGLTAAHAEIEKLLRMLGLMKKQAKSVMILGGGRPAFYLSRLLTSAGSSSVRIIERDSERCEFLSRELPGAVVIKGDGAEQDVLLEEGLGSVDAFVSLTGMDEENILASIFAGTHKVPKIITKINRDELIAMAEKLGLETIVSTSSVTSNLLLGFVRALENTEGSNIETLYRLMDGRAEALEFNARDTEGLTGIPLKQLKLKKNVLIAGIMRGRKTIIPSGDDMLLPDDRVVVLASGHRFGDLSDILL